MATCALQTTTMLHPVASSPIQLLGQAPKRDDRKPQLPSKRKRDIICGLGSFNQPFTIKPHPGSPYDKPAIFKPVRIIARSQLPLTFLDRSSDDNFAANSLFSAHISILESHEEPGKKGEQIREVLVARYETKKTLYAIEQVKPRVYSICKLANWLKEKDVADLWDPASRNTWTSLPGTSTTVMGEWWQHAIMTTQPTERPPKRAKMTMMRRIPAQETTTGESKEPFNVSETQEPEHAGMASGDLPQEPVVPLPQELLASLLDQYLNAVYMAKTSLAYFAKGPISRIRNAFTLADQDAPATWELTTFLRSMLLSAKASEKKYYEKLPATIKTIPLGSFSDDEIVEGIGKGKKSKRKQKLSREGVYPQEELLIKKWWLSELPNGDGLVTETMDQRIKRRIGDLRVREALAQLILMLEVVGLEALSTYKAPSEELGARDETQAQAQGEPLTKPKKRKRKLDDIHLQLDLLLDKLCIWHATEEVGIMDFDTRPPRQNESADGSGANSANDRLHSFCVEVIIPFYMNRLPEQALMVNKKLGGPAHTSPPKRKAMKPPTTSRKSGEPKETERKKPRRSLARVATDTIGRPVERTTPSLNRSLTDSSVLNGIKREGSEVPLSAIPFQRSPSKSARQSMSQIRHLQGRQIDLSQPSAAATAKQKQKQRVEEDLQDAILALKKPNRGLAAGGYVEDIERRGLGSTNRSRKAANPVRKIVRDVQVSATPRAGRRTKDIIEQTPSRQHHRHLLFPVPMTEATPSSNFCIPSSAARQPSTVAPGTAQPGATARHLAHASIAETPSKAPNTKTFTSGAARRTIFSTPFKPTLSAAQAGLQEFSHVFETPAKIVDSLPPTRTKSTILATPTKFAPVSATGAVTVHSSPPKNIDQESSIYDALGWNDDGDDL